MSLYLGDKLIAGAGTPTLDTRNVGQIIQSAMPLTDAGLHLLDGSVISGSGSYAAFVTYIAGLVSDYPDLFETEANWQTSVTNYGVCGKFVYDSVNSTVRLPKLYNQTRHLIKSYKSGTDWYNIYSDGWCEQGGEKTNSGINTHQVTFLKEFTDTNYYFNRCNESTVTGTSTSFASEGYTDKQTTGIKAYCHSSITKCIWEAKGYTDVSDLEQETIYPYIVIANSTKTEIEVDIDEIATDLNGKADVDLTNCTKPHIVETYSNGTSWYRVYSDGWCEQGGKITSNDTSDTQVIFLKEFADTNYSVVGLQEGGNGLAQYCNGWRLSNLATTSCYVYNATNGTNSFHWRACGYIS